MGERESRRVDRWAIFAGLRRFVAVTVLTFGFTAGVRFAFRPIVSDLAGGATLPNVWYFAVGSALVGVIGGWGRLRNARRFVASGHNTASTGSGALAVARHNRAALRDAGLAQSAPIQRWSDDLLTGGDSLSVEALKP